MSFSYFWLSFRKRQSHTGIRVPQISLTQNLPPGHDLHMALSSIEESDPMTHPDDEFPFLDASLVARMREHNLPLPSGTRMPLVMKTPSGHDSTSMPANPRALGKLVPWTSSPLQKGTPHKPILEWRRNTETPNTRDESEAHISATSRVHEQRRELWCLPGHPIPRTRGQIVLPGRRILVSLEKWKAYKGPF